MSKTVFERLQQAEARIDRAIPLAGAISAIDAVSDDLEEFLEEDEDVIERCLGPLPGWLKDELDSPSAGDALCDWIDRSDKFGWLLCVATPVMTHQDGLATFSWGYCFTEWVYGDTFDEALAAALAWVAGRRIHERAKPAAKRARKRAPR